MARGKGRASTSSAKKGRTAQQPAELDLDATEAELLSQVSCGAACSELPPFTCRTALAT